MISERHEELAALYALGLLEGAELHAFETELEQNAELAAFTASLTKVSEDLACAAPSLTPPPELRARVLAATKPIPARGWPALVPWGLAAALAIAAIWFATQRHALREENRLLQVAYERATRDLSDNSALANKMIGDLKQRLARSEDLARLKVSALASLAGNTKEAQAIAVWDPDQQAGLLSFERLPATADTQDYQIWVIDPAYVNPVNGGVFHVAKDGTVSLPFKPDQPVAQASAFAISLEKKGGVPKAEGPIVLLGKLPAK